MAENTLEVELGPYLFDEQENLLIQADIPFIDLGDKPSTFGPNRPESE